MSIPPMLANGSAVGGWARGGWVRVLSRVPSSSRPARRSSGCVFARQGHRRCLYSRGPGTLGPGGRKRRSRRAVHSPGGAIDVVYTPAARNTRVGGMETPWGRARGVGLWAGASPLVAWFAGVLLGPVGRVLLLSLSVRWGGTAGIRAGRGRSDPWGRSGRSGPRRACVGCVVSGRLVRRRCRSGRCAGGTRGRDWTARWW